MLEKTLLKQFITIFFSSVLLGCATPGDDYKSAGDPAQIRSDDCFSQSSIRNYQILDDRNLIVTGAGSRAYHVELASRALDLRSSWSIGFQSRSGLICSSSTLLVNDGFGSRGSATRLRSVRQLDSDELDALLVQFGKKEPENPVEQPDSAPEEIKGAEVEELG